MNDNTARFPQMTLRNLNDFTDEQIVAEVTMRLLEQGSAAVCPGGQCRYRTDDGRKCAVGLLLDDADYRKEYEGRGAGRLLEAVGLWEQLYDKRGLLTALQSIHDNSRDPVLPHLFHKQLRRAAEWATTYGTADERTAARLVLATIDRLHPAALPHPAPTPEFYPA